MNIEVSLAAHHPELGGRPDPRYASGLDYALKSKGLELTPWQLRRIPRVAGFFASELFLCGGCGNTSVDRCETETQAHYRCLCCARTRTVPLDFDAGPRTEAFLIADTRRVTYTGGDPHRKPRGGNDLSRVLSKREMARLGA